MKKGGEAISKTVICDEEYGDEDGRARVTTDETWVLHVD